MYKKTEIVLVASPFSKLIKMKKYEKILSTVTVKD